MGPQGPQNHACNLQIPFVSMAGLLRLTMVLYGLIMVLHGLLWFFMAKNIIFLMVKDPNSFNFCLRWHFGPFWGSGGFNGCVLWGKRPPGHAPEKSGPKGPRNRAKMDLAWISGLSPLPKWLKMPNYAWERCSAKKWITLWRLCSGTRLLVIYQISSAVGEKLFCIKWSQLNMLQYSKRIFDVDLKILPVRLRLLILVRKMVIVAALIWNK